MSGPFVKVIRVQDFSAWEKNADVRTVLSFDLEVTARCNQNCRHCYVNLPADDKKAHQKELSFSEIKKIAGQAVDLGALWCLVTGGEPLLRADFVDIYLFLKKGGLLVSVFTNATLITQEHIKLFKEHPPRDIEVTVYGVTERTYERVTRTPGSFKAFMRGVDLLLSTQVRVHFKAMALRSNLHELPKIAEFCRKKTKDYFRFDPFLHMRLDQNQVRNEEIRSERLTPDEIVMLEKADPDRSKSLRDNCNKLVPPEFLSGRPACPHIFQCGAGHNSFVIGYDGNFRLCSSLRHRDCCYDLRRGDLAEAWRDFVPEVRGRKSTRKDFLEKCRICPIVNLCMWCPAHAYLEAQEMDRPIEYFCAVAHARARSLGKANVV